MKLSDDMSGTVVAVNSEVSAIKVFVCKNLLLSFLLTIVKP